jgi:hypothetical protein
VQKKGGAGGGFGGHGHPGRRRTNSRTSMAQRDEVIRRTVYVSDIDHQVRSISSSHFGVYSRQLGIFLSRYQPTYRYRSIGRSLMPICYFIFRRTTRDDYSVRFWVLSVRAPAQQDEITRSGDLLSGLMSAITRGAQVGM